MGATERDGAGSAGPRVRCRGARSSTTPSAPGCTPRRGCSAGNTSSTRPTSAPPTCRGQRCSTAWSGTSGCPGSARRRCSRSSAPPSTPTGTTPRSSPTTRTGTATGSTMPSPRHQARLSTTGSPSRSPASRCGPTPTSRRCSKRSRRSASSTTVTATWSSRRPAPARPSSLRSTTAASVMPRPASGPRCSSSPIAGRSSSSRSAPIARCSPTPNFGELYVGGVRPERWRHVFASVQSLHVVRRRRTSRPTPTTSSSSTSSTTPRPRRTAGSSITSRPEELLGLTATPERADGVDVRSLLRRSDRRRAAAVGRARRRPAVPLPLLRRRRRHGPARDQLDAWPVRRARAVERLHRQRRIARRIVLTQLRDKVLDPGVMRALGFCVSVAHAEFMATVFNDAGIPARAVSGNTPQADRERALAGPARTVGSTCCSPPTCSTRVSTCRTSTRCCSCAPPRAPRSSCSSSGAACGGPATKAVLTVAGLRGLPPQGVPLRRQAPRPDRAHAPGPGARDPARLPLPAVRLPDRHGQAGAEPGAGEHQVADRQPLAADRGRAAPLRRPGPRHLPATNPGSNSPTFCGAAVTPGRDCVATPVCPHAAGSALEDKLLKRVRAFAHVDDRRASRGLRARSCPTTPRRTTSCRRSEQRLARMLFFSLWSDGGGHASYDEGLARAAAGAGHPRRAAERRRPVLRRGSPSGAATRRSAGRRAAAGPRPVPARRDPRCARLRDSAAQAEHLPRGRLVRRRTSTSTPSS